MAQPAQCIRSTFGLQCCLLFLLASWEAGATTVQELQKTGESPTSDHILPPTPSPVYTTLSDHTALHSGHSPADLPKSTETHQPKRCCNTTHSSKLIHKSIDNSGSSTTHHEAPPTSEQNPSNQGKDTVIRNKRSADFNSTQTDKGSSKYPTPAPKSKTTCRKSKTTKQIVTRNSAETITTLEKTIITLVSKSTSSHKTTNPSHNSFNSETNKTPTSTSEKTTTATSTPYQGTRISGRSERADDHTTTANYRPTVDSDKKLIRTTENIKDTSQQETTAASEVTTVSEKPTEQQQETRAAHKKTTCAPVKPTEQRQETTAAHRKTTGAPAKPTKHVEKTTSATETIKAPVKPTENPAATETTRPPVEVTGDKSITNTSPHPKKPEVTHQVPTGSFAATTSSLELGSITSEAPANKSQPNQNKDGSEGGLQTAESEEKDSFPSWAIVIVILLAVILLLVFFGLIFLVSYMMRRRRALIRNTEDNDPENDVGPNSYPVYLMEQQTLGMSQIPSPR
uniref:Mucin like 3 n=1 Tax=Equus caballus TaxID=9796 RepID=A0A3Q2I6L1_HORSE